jgi:toxin ParE1/3/4
MDQIWAYIAADSIAAADRTIDRLFELYRMLVRQPLIGQERPDLQKGVREFPSRRYVVYYLPTADGIQVVRIIHSARNVTNLA